MRKALKGLVGFIDQISKWSGTICVWLIFLVMFLILMEVFLRYVLNCPTNWGFEASGMVFGAFALLSGAYAQLHKSHVTMDIFYNKWTIRKKATVDSFTYIIFFIFCGVLIWGSTGRAIESVSVLEHSNSAWGPPVYPIKIAIAGAAILLFLQGLSDFIRNVTVSLTGREL